MKKALLLLTLVVLAILLITPQFIGASFRGDMLDYHVALVNAETPLTLEQISYEGGWFESQAEFELSYPVASLPLINTNSEASPEELTVLLPMRIRHGPLLLTPGGPRLGMAYAEINPELKDYNLDELAESLTTGTAPAFEAPPVRYSLLARFDQSAEFSMEVGAIALDSDTGQPESSAALASLRASIDVARNQSARTRVEAEQIRVDSAQFQIQMPSITFDMRTRDLSAALAPGEATLRVPDMRMERPLALSIDSLEAGYRIRTSRRQGVQEEELERDQERAQVQPHANFDLSQSFSISRIESELPMDALDWQMSLTNANLGLLNSASFDELIDSAQRRSGLQTDENALPADQFERELALALLQDPLNYEAALSVSAFDASHEFGLNLAWPGRPQLQSLDQLSPRQAFEAIEGEFALEADEEALLSSPYSATISAYVDQGLIRSDSGKLVIAGSLLNGILILNGQVIPVADLFLP